MTECIIVWSVALASGIALSIVGAKLEDNIYGGRGDFVGILSVFSGWILTFVSIVGLLIVVPTAMSSKARADILNASFGTHYTAEQVFWAGDTIEKIVQGEKHRIDITTH